MAKIISSNDRDLPMFSQFFSQLTVFFAIFYCFIISLNIIRHSIELTSAHWTFAIKPLFCSSSQLASYSFGPMRKLRSQILSSSRTSVAVRPSFVCAWTEDNTRRNILAGTYWTSEVQNTGTYSTSAVHINNGCECYTSSLMQFMHFDLPSTYSAIYSYAFLLTVTFQSRTTRHRTTDRLQVFINKCLRETVKYTLSPRCLGADVNYK